MLDYFLIVLFICVKGLSVRNPFPAGLDKMLGSMIFGRTILILLYISFSKLKSTKVGLVEIYQGDATIG